MFDRQLTRPVVQNNTRGNPVV